MKRMFLVAATLLAAGVVGPVSAQNITYTVDCSKGQTIGAALQRGDARKPLTILVRGTCNEYVQIVRDDVTLRGVPPGGAVNGPGTAAPAVHIQANRVSVEDLLVTGGGNGVLLGGPFLAFMTNVVVDSPAGGSAALVRAGGDLSISGGMLMHANNGLQLGRGGSARLFGNAEIRENAGSGVYASGNATFVAAAGTKILDNGQNGVQLEDSSQGNIIGTEISGNRNGLFLSASEANVSGGSVISNNRENGVAAFLGSTLVLRGNEIAHNAETGVYCRWQCTLQLAGANIHDNMHHAVLVMLGSRAIFQPPMTVATGNGWEDLWCGDSETSVDGVEGLSVDGGVFFSGSVSPNCTGFND
jgi:parallel beta-helix repeat protein